MEAKSYQQGERIVSEGETLNQFYVLLSGRARVYRKQKKIRSLGEQDVFGLEGLLGDKTSPYEVRATSPCRVMAYDHEMLDHFLESRPRMVRSLLLSIVRQMVETSLFLAGDEVVVLPEDVEVHYYEDGETIIREGDIGREFYRLISSEGGLVVHRAGKEIGRIDQPGEFFGEMAGILKAPRQATVVSSGESVVQVFNGHMLENVISDNPQLGIRLIRTLARRLMQANVKLTEGDLNTDQWKDFL